MTSPILPSAPPTISRLADLSSAAKAAPDLITAIDAIFFETTVRTFNDAANRAAFRNLWLGQYLDHDAAHVHIARDSDGVVIGYLVGCWDNPALSPRFATLGYLRAFKDVAAEFPAHLHVNLTAGARNHGVGARLIEAFCQRTAAAGLLGVHVVTGATARNVRFYHRLGFQERAKTSWNGHDVVFLGRKLSW